MTRDRLAALRANLPEDEGVVIMMAGTHEHGGSLLQFTEEVEIIMGKIAEMEQIVEEVNKLHAAILLAPQSEEKSKQQLDSLMNQYKRIADKVRLRLKDIELGNEKVKEKKGEDVAEYRIRKTQQAMMLKKFLAVMTNYNNIQVDYREKCKARIQRQLEITGRSTTKDELEVMLESGNPSIFTQSIITDTQQAKQSLADIEARHSDIMKLESSIRELHELFLEMAQLVESQGEMIDVIQHQVSQTKEYVVQANNEIKQALDYQAKANRKKLCCYSILVVLFIILFGGLIMELLR